MKVSLYSLPLLAGLIVWCFFLATNAEDFPSFEPLVTKESRRTLVSTESGVVTAVDVRDGLKAAYHLQFITLEPSSLFLPVLLHADMVFYVQTGRGTVSWVREDSEDGTTELDVERGDIYRIEEGSIVYVRSHPDPAREKLRIHAIFNNFDSENPQEAYIGAYSNVSDLVRGFDDRVLRMGFKVSEEDVKAIKSAIKPPPIVHFAPNKTEKPNWNEVFETLIGGRNPISLINGKKKGKGKSKTKTKTFNVFNESPDVKNCNGWSVAVTNRDLKALEASDIGVFMVNLTKGAMMGPHWNPKATEISIVLQGHGMVQVVCPSSSSGKPSLNCQTMRFMVKEGDTFIVPRFHPMAHMSFNNDSLVFMGFSTSVANNRPQYLAGKWSVLRTIDKDILAMAFGASDTTVKKMFGSQGEGVMLECTSCAEEAERTMQEEIQRKKEEEARKREEEEARKREEEARKRKEEEEARKREEEARKRKEEEARKREEEAREREKEEEAREREEEAARRKEEEEEEARKREEEKARKREEEEREREEARKKEEEKKREREEEEARKREEEEAGKRKEEKAPKREEEGEEGARRREEEEIRRQEEQEIRRQEEEAREREAGGGDRKEAAAGEGKEEEAEKSKGEEEEASRREEEEIRRQEEEEIRRQEEEARERETGGGGRKKEEESGKSKEEEAGKREGDEEEAGRQEEEEEEIRRQEEEEYKRQEEEAREREAGRDRKREDDEERSGRDGKTSGAERVMWRKLWNV